MPDSQVYPPRYYPGEIGFQSMGSSHYWDVAGSIMIPVTKKKCHIYLTAPHSSYPVRPLSPGRFLSYIQYSIARLDRDGEYAVETLRHEFKHNACEVYDSGEFLILIGDPLYKTVAATHLFPQATQQRIVQFIA